MSDDMTVREAIDHVNTYVSRFVRPLEKIDGVLKAAADAESQIVAAQAQLAEVQAQIPVAEAAVESARERQRDAEAAATQAAVEQRNAEQTTQDRMQELERTYRQARQSVDDDLAAFKASTASEKTAIERDIAAAQDRLNSLLSQIEALKRQFA